MPALRASVSRWYLLFIAVVGMIYFPFLEWQGQVAAWAVIGLSSVTAIIYGTYRNRPNVPRAWGVLAAGVFLFITGDTMYKFSNQILHHTPPFPSIIDVIYITMYPTLAVGLLLLVRARVPGGDRASLLDALTVTAGLALLSWVFLIVPYFRAPDLSILERLTSVAYPLGDVLLLAMLAHLWSAGGLRNAAGRFLAIGTVGCLVSDSLYGAIQLHGTWHDGNPVDFGWMLFYACWGAAALHPSMRDLAKPVLAATHRTSRSRLFLLAGVSLIAPIVLLSETMFGTPVDAAVIGVAAGVMFLLVLTRMAGLVNVHQQAVTREQVLRSAAADLVAASGREALYEAVLADVGALASGQGEISVSMAVAQGTGADLEIVARSENSGAAQEVLPAPVSLPAGLRDQLLTGDAARCQLSDFPELGGSEDKPSLLICPLVTDDKLSGLVAVASAREWPVDLARAIETLSSQVALALESEALTEAFHAARSEARFQALVQNASDVILIVHPDTTIIYQTPSTKRILGYQEGLEGSRLTELLHPDDVQQAIAVWNDTAYRTDASTAVAWRLRHQDGSWRDVEVVANNLLGDADVEGIVLTIRDVSDRKRLEEELKHQAFHDSLCGLANRALFGDRLEQALARAARSQRPLAVLFIDLDDFKIINDTLGHSAGDELLVAVAQRLTEALRAGDTAARFGGDEFAVLLEDVRDLEEARFVAERIISSLRPTVTVGDQQVNVQASLGIALSPEGSDSPSDLLQAADVAMYAAKARGKGCCEVYEPMLRDAIIERLERTSDLQRALDAREFELYYQPIVDLADSRIIGVEALARWNHPVRGLCLPKDFIALAEDTGLIIPFSRWVLEEACKQARSWHVAGAPELTVSVNISARHFQQEGIVDDVARAIELAGLDPASLVLEITESALLQDAGAVVTRMIDLKMLGVQFAIDDFGTGYSSLSYLQRFPIDILKVDKSFVDGVGDSVEEGALADAIVQLGRTLHLQTIAEGIEQPRQVAGLRAMACHYGQGFFFERPGTAQAIGELIARQHALVLPDGSTSNGVALNGHLHATGVQR
ncbi:MAG: putative bifunctional diguanylate cyclase/phosphodiesterase [Acidimicrobiales bacterium]